MNPRYPALFSIAALLTACATPPTEPSVLALPGTGKNFAQFRADDDSCRQYAFDRTSGSRQAATEAGVKSAAVGTAIGAVAGAAIGGRDGAAVGAGSGLVVGSMAGSDSASHGAYGAQRRYDHAYIQCMYAAGHRVPVPGGMLAPAAPAESRTSTPPPPPPPPPPPSR